MITRRSLLANGAAALAAADFARTAPARGRASALHAGGPPLPSAAQLAWQRAELAMFVHFSINTFTGQEWGDGRASPKLFDPSALDPRQWARTARATGFRAMILTAKHHDGFCLWPTATTPYSVRASPYRGGAGDVVAEFTAACRAEGLATGLYLSPWDRHAPSYGSGKAYNDYYVAQLTELLTRYGPLNEIWFDGANGEGPSGRHQAYDWPRIHATVRRLQPGALIFSDAGPDLRWVGEEHGIAPVTCWGSIDPERVPYPGYNGPDVAEALGMGDPLGSVWRPAEADVSIRPGWFWHAAEDTQVKTGEDLLRLYVSSAGRNSKLLLNVPPTRVGVFDQTDVRSLGDFARLRGSLLAVNRLQGARVRASSAAGGHAPSAVLDANPDTYWAASPHERRSWLAFETSAPVEFDTLRLAEAIALGQQIAGYRLECRTPAGVWRTVTWGTTVGCQKIDRFAPVTARQLRLEIEFAYGPPRLAAAGLYRSAES
jgi:alpha-L-fucosidase